MSAEALAPVVMLVTDVFGHTPAVDAMLRTLNVQAVIVSPFDEAGFHFDTEPDAYQSFVVNGGVAAYARKVRDIQQRYQSSLRYIIGFSAGASAVWMASAHAEFAGIQQAVLFYGSRIRDARNVRPVCPTRLIFAEQEVAFKPAELVADLYKRGHQAELIRGTSHGFMNVYSAGSCVKTQDRFLQELHQLINQPALDDAA